MKNRPGERKIASPKNRLRNRLNRRWNVRGLMQELCYTCNCEGRGYFEIGDYEHALQAFGEARKSLESTPAVGAHGLDAYRPMAYADPVLASASHQAEQGLRKRAVPALLFSF